jgi:hypothetical protein
MGIIFLIMGLIVGGLMIFFVTNRHYERAHRQLKDEVIRLRQLNVRLLWNMEQAGLIKWTRDSQGNIIGLDIRSKSALTVTERTVENKTIH